MAVSGLKGSFPLTEADIKREIKHIAPGVYTLGNMKDDKYHTLYVGRADKNLKEILMKCLRQTERFKYMLFDDPEEAFKKECELYHLFKPAANRVHPPVPPTRDWKCPDCGFKG
jgi:excinuclease UvrABC nuclease subunit